MSQELHYTSVPRGLQPGSRGFCVVAATPNLPAPLRERLEGLSGYQQVFPPHDSRAGLNPVVFAHHRLNLGGRPQSVLSRVAFAGLDYTDRANKYAHHVVIEPAERPAGGPAWLLSRPGFMDPSWSGDPRVLPSGRAVPRGDAAPGIAAAWRSATGDAGWAGALAEAFLSNPSRPAYLIYEPGVDPLPLFAEALALLPPARRWDVDFNTYFTAAPQGLNCAWRGVLAGTPAAAAALKTPGALVLDLTRPMASLGDGPLTHQARTGERPAATESASIAPAPRARPTTGAPAPRADDFAVSLADDDLPVIDLAPIPPSVPGRAATRGERFRTPAPRRSRFQAARWWISGAAILLLLLGGGSIVFYFGGGSEADALIDQAAGRIPKVEDPPPAVAAARAPAPPQAAAPPRVAAEKPQEPVEVQGPPVAAAEKPMPPAEPDFVHRPLFMDLPKLPARDGTGGAWESIPAPPLKLGANVLKIALHQFATVRDTVGEPAKPALKLREPAPVGEANVWAIGPNDDDKAESIAYTTFDVAELRIQPEGLVVAWSTGGASREGFAKLAEALRDAVLELTTDLGRKFVVLRDLKPAGQPFQLSGPGRSAGERDELIMSWATGETLNQSAWKWTVRRYRIDVTAGDPDDGAKDRLLSEESTDGAGKSEFVLIPKSARLELKPAEGEGGPQTDKISIVLNLDNHENEIYKDAYNKAAKRIKNRRADLDAALKSEPVDQKKVDELNDSIAKAEIPLRELDEYIQKYKWIKNNNGARLSLIIGLRLDDGTFLDLARIGTFPEPPNQP